MASDRQVSAAGELPAVPTVVLVHGRSFDPGGEPVPKQYGECAGAGEAD
jgi:hypothetical protein